jgi:hypothetical protein
MRGHRSLLVAFLVGVPFWLRPASAHAQYEGDPVEPWGKGLTGGALLGAEAVTLTEAAIGVKPAWAYLVGGAAGAVGGGVGGYFAEEKVTAKVSLYLLAGGMALVIPTTIAVLHQTQYEPPVEFTQDAPPEDEPLAEPPAPEAILEGGPTARAPASDRARRGGTPGGAPSPAARIRAPLCPALVPPPPALFAIRSRRAQWSVPAVEVRDVYTRRDRFEFGVRQGTEFSVPIFAGTF